MLFLVVAVVVANLVKELRLIDFTFAPVGDSGLVLKGLGDPSRELHPDKLS